MTTLIAWYGRQGDMVSANIIGDGRISHRNGFEPPLADNFPKVLPITFGYSEDLEEGGLIKSKRMSIGIAFTGNTLAATAAIETFRQLVETISGPKGSEPSLLQFADLLSEVHWHHRSSSNYPDERKAEFLMVGHCPLENCTQIIRLKHNPEPMKLQVSIVPSGVIEVLGIDKDNINLAISKMQAEEVLLQDVDIMNVLYKLCNSGGTKFTGGTISLGYFNPYYQSFNMYIVQDYDLDEEGVLESRWSLNGFDTSKVKELIPGFRSAGMAFSPFPFTDRMRQLRSKN